MGKEVSSVGTGIGCPQTSNNRYENYKTVKKIVHFIKSYHSILFFGCSLAFSYYMAPIEAFRYIQHFSSFTEAFFNGTLLGGSFFIVGTILGMQGIKKDQNHLINYLVACINFLGTKLNPTQGLLNAVSNIGFICTKSIYANFVSVKPKVGILKNINDN